MHILLLAPHPFYQERGTPIAVDLLLRALVKRGDHIDVLTYHEGENRDYGSTVKLHRIRAPRWVSGIRPGFSLKKLICDAIMMPHARRLVKQHAFDVIHAVEESVFIAQQISRQTGIPYIFDMDSSMPRQIADKKPILTPLLPIMRGFEHRAIRHAEAVVPMCDALAVEARTAGAKRVTILRDISLLQPNIEFAAERGFRRQTGIQGPVVLYIGNLEPYQGIDLLINGVAHVIHKKHPINLVLVGGRQDDITHYREVATTARIAKHVHFLGPRPISDMAHLFHDANILASPRIQGDNTPMKIYSYLDAGRPLIATRLPTHTQVLDEQVALLTEPTPAAFGDALIRLLENPELARQLASKAHQMAQQRYSLSVFEKSVNHLYEQLSNV